MFGIQQVEIESEIEGVETGSEMKTYGPGWEHLQGKDCHLKKKEWIKNMEEAMVGI